MILSLAGMGAHDGRSSKFHTTAVSVLKGDLQAPTPSSLELSNLGGSTFSHPFRAAQSLVNWTASRAFLARITMALQL